jgi:hypothetical protein
MLVYTPDNWRQGDLVTSMHLGMKDFAKNTNGLEADPIKCQAIHLKEIQVKEGL